MWGDRSMKARGAQFIASALVVASIVAGGAHICGTSFPGVSGGSAVRIDQQHPALVELASAAEAADSFQADGQTAWTTLADFAESPGDQGEQEDPDAWRTAEQSSSEWQDASPTEPTGNPGQADGGLEWPASTDPGSFDGTAACGNGDASSDGAGSADNEPSQANASPDAAGLTNGDAESGHAPDPDDGMGASGASEPTVGQTSSAAVPGTSPAVADPSTMNGSAGGIAARCNDASLDSDSGGTGDLAQDAALDAEKIEANAKAAEALDEETLALTAAATNVSTATLDPSKYTLAYLTDRGYQAVVFGNAFINQDTQGGILVQGNLEEGYGSAGLANSPTVEAPSYVGGLVVNPRVGFNHTSKQNPVQVLYVGTSNTIENDGKKLNGADNGGNGYNYYGVVEYNDGYIDWGSMYAAMTSLSSRLSAGSGQTKSDFWDWCEASVPAGTNVSFSGSGGYKVKVVIEGSSEKFTVINILDGGTVYMPEVIRYNGQELSKADDGYDTPVIFNFPNASKVIVPNDMTPSHGHIIAPYADVQIEGGNYNGTVICNNFSASGEGHIRTFHGDFPGPASFTVRVLKVDQDGNGLAGASLAVCDANGTQVDTFISDGSAHELTLPAGTYTLAEKAAPEGYLAAEGIAFTVDANGVVTVGGVVVDAATVTMVDVHEPPVTVELGARKVFENGELAGGDFTFVLDGVTETSTTEQVWVSDGWGWTWSGWQERGHWETSTTTSTTVAPMPAGSIDGRLSATNAADGSVDFGTVTFDTEGTWTYRISEQSGDQPANGDTIAYDATVFSAVVTVTRVDGRLAASVSYRDAQGNALGAGSLPTFTNHRTAYVPFIEMPETGSTGAATCSAFGALLATFGILLRGHRSESIDEKRGRAMRGR